MGALLRGRRGGEERRSWTGPTSCSWPAWPSIPGNASILYNAACYRALAGHGDEAIELLSQAFAADPKPVRRWSAGDSDLDSIRDRPDWPVPAS